MDERARERLIEEVCDREGLAESVFTGDIELDRARKSGMETFFRLEKALAAIDPESDKRVKLTKEAIRDAKALYQRIARIIAAKD